MPNFAKIISNKVDDVFLADDATVLQAMFPKALIVEETESTGVAFINGEFKGGIFIPPQPFPSWVYQESINSWLPPVEPPQNGNAHFWNEDSLTWEVTD